MASLTNCILRLPDSAECTNHTILYICNSFGNTPQKTVYSPILGNAPVMITCAVSSGHTEVRTQDYWEVLSMKLEIRAMTQKERAFSYTQETEVLEKAGCVGHLRGDMGKGGNEFFTPWDDHVQELKTDAFKQEFDKVVNLLRFDERYGGLLHDRASLAAYCKSNPDSAFEGNYTQEYAFRADTETYSYMIRCNPSKGDYNFYVYAYEKSYFGEHVRREGERDDTDCYLSLFGP